MGNVKHYQSFKMVDNSAWNKIVVTSYSRKLPLVVTLVLHVFCEMTQRRVWGSFWVC